MTIHQSIEQAWKNADGVGFFSGLVADMVTELNSKSVANEDHQPALFFVDEFKMQYDGDICEATLNILLTVPGSNDDRTKERNERNFDKKLPDLRKKFLTELERLPSTVAVKTSTEWRRPKVNKAFSIMQPSTTVFNNAMDGWEMIIIYKTNSKDCTVKSFGFRTI